MKPWEVETNNTLDKLGEIGITGIIGDSSSEMKDKENEVLKEENKIDDISKDNTIEEDKNVVKEEKQDSK